MTAFYLVRLVLRGVAVPAPEPFVATLRVDVNTAGIPELMALPGMGRTRAAAVVLHRVRYGWFREVADLAAVDGIGPVTLTNLRPFLVDPPRRVE